MRDRFTDVDSMTEAERLGRLYPIRLEPHNPEWELWYESEKTSLLEVFKDAVVRVQHIGSTAVPGLTAKPTVDILLEISQGTELTGITAKLTGDGYIVNRPPNDVILFIKGYGEHGFEGRVFHIHVRYPGDHSELYFRDYLMSHPEAAEEYEALKRKLKDRYEHDRDGYTAGKSAFVQKCTALAREEFGGRYLLDEA